MENKAPTFIKYQGFHPSSFTEAYLSKKLTQLAEQTPLGSVLKATFSRTNDAFKGMIEISCSSARFFAIARGTRIKGVTHKLIEQIRRQIDRWRTRRSQSKAPIDFQRIKSTQLMGATYDENRVA